MANAKAKPAAAERRKCRDCGTTRSVDKCPGCGIELCTTCAEREGEFCCDGDGRLIDG